MKRKTVFMLALVLVFALMFTACAVRRPLQTPAQQGTNTGYYNNNRTGTRNMTGTGTGTGTYTATDTGYTDSYGVNYGGYGVNYDGYNNGMYGGYNNNTNYGVNNTGTATTQADRLARSCEGVAGVNNATVVVSGNTAYVGLDTAGKNVAYGTPNNAANNISSVKRQCAQRIRSANPQIQKVYVSTDANFFDRLRRVGDGIRNGSAVTSFRNELDGLVRGLVPERL